MTHHRVVIEIAAETDVDAPDDRSLSLTLELYGEADSLAAAVLRALAPQLAAEQLATPGG